MQKFNDKPIGLIDSGVGGLTVLKQLIRKFPDERFVYYGDTLHLPYGPRLLREVRGFTFKIITFLLDKRDVRMVVIACNTASSAALSQARKFFKIPIFGTVGPAVNKAVQVSSKGRIGVIGTEGTVNSQVYQQALLKKDNSYEVFSAACPGFVDMVEEGIVRGPIVVGMAQKYLEGLKQTGIDTLILGCTHFPYLKPVIRLVMGKKIALIDPAEELAEALENKFNKDIIKERNVYDNYFRGGEREYPAKILGKDMEAQFKFIVSNKNKISDLLWQSDFVIAKEIPNLTEINIFR